MGKSSKADLILHGADAGDGLSQERRLKVEANMHQTSHEFIECCRRFFLSSISSHPKQTYFIVMKICLLLEFIRNKER